MTQSNRIYTAGIKSYGAQLSVVDCVQQANKTSQRKNCTDMTQQRSKALRRQLMARLRAGRSVSLLPVRGVVVHTTRGAPIAQHHDVRASGPPSG